MKCASFIWAGICALGVFCAPFLVSADTILLEEPPVEQIVPTEKLFDEPVQSEIKAAAEVLAEVHQDKVSWNIKKEDLAAAFIKALANGISLTVAIRTTSDMPWSSALTVAVVGAFAKRSPLCTRSPSRT